MSDQDMNLPEGKTCSDCAHYKRCVALFDCPATNKQCDWAPSRFRQRVVDLCAHGFPHPCSLCSGDNELAKMLRLRKELDPDAPDMIAMPDETMQDVKMALRGYHEGFNDALKVNNVITPIGASEKAREAAYEIIGLMNPDVNRVEQIILKYFP